LLPSISPDKDQHKSLLQYILEVMQGDYGFLTEFPKLAFQWEQDMPRIDIEDYLSSHDIIVIGRRAGIDQYTIIAKLGPAWGAMEGKTITINITARR
jgi:hypothetical protein